MDTRVAQNTYNFFKLEGKVAIITGAGNGIGKATAKMMASFGVKVIACDIELDSVCATVAEIIGAGWTGKAVECDITNRDQIRATVEKIIAEYGTIDILVNNAATMGGGKTIDQVDEKEFERLINVNLTGVFNFIYAVLPIMRAKKYGKIISVSSGAGVIGCDTDYHYCAAKGGVIAMSKGLARQLGQEKINVNVIAPGLTNTRMAHEWEFGPALERFYRIGEPEDMAATICFLASDSASYFSGQVLSPNGGEYMI